MTSFPISDSACFAHITVPDSSYLAIYIPPLAVSKFEPKLIGSKWCPGDFYWFPKVSKVLFNGLGDLKGGLGALVPS